PEFPSWASARQLHTYGRRDDQPSCRIPLRMCDFLQHQCFSAGKTASAGALVCPVINAGSCPREIGAGLLYSLLKSVVMANKLCPNESIGRAVITLGNTFI